MIPIGKEREPTITDYWQIIQKRRWIILTCFVVLEVSVAFMTFRMTPVYRATTVIMIEQNKARVAPVEEVYGVVGMDREYYQTQYKIIRSRTLVKLVFDELDLYIDPDFSKAKDPVDAFLAKLNVEPVRDSRLVNVSFEGTDPRKITTIVNALASIYIKQDLDIRTKASKEAVSWLLEQLTTMKKKVEESERAVQDYMAKEKILEAPEEQKKTTDLIDSLKKEQARIEIDVSELAKRYGDRHPNMQRLLTELASVKAKLEAELQHITVLNQKATQFNILKRDTDSNRQLYDALLKRAKEAGVTEELQTSNIRVIDPAEVPESPFKPNTRNNIILGAILGLLCGISLAFFIEYLDNTVKSPEDVEEYIKLPFLGYVSSAKKDAKTQLQVDLITHQKSRSVVSEAYRSIRTAIMFAFADKPAKALLITSAGPQEGKTTITINLATTMAQAGDKVLLIDADMRCPRVHKTFNAETTNGLSDLLVEKVDLNTAIKMTEIPNLSIITCGSIPPNPSELLGTHRMKVLLEEAANRFDHIIFDSPPLVNVTDASILANILDGVILVIRSGQTPIELVIRGKQKLLDAKANILGVVLNNVDMAQESYYYYYYYGGEGEKTKKHKT